MKLSIIIPVYNTEKYLQQCINSILESTFSDYELLLVDDGSTDKSGRICDEYVGKDERIRVFHQENGGVSKARNVGIDNAKAPWITFIDADDWISETFLENLYEVVEEHPDVDFVQAGCTNYRGGEIGEMEQHYEFYVGNDMQKLFTTFRGLSISKLYKKQLLSESFHVRYDEDITYLEDFLFTLDYISQIHSYVFLPEEGYYYRRDNDTSITHGDRNFSYEYALHLYKHMFRGMEAYIRNHKICDIPKFRVRALAEHMWFAICVLYREIKSQNDRYAHLQMDFNLKEKKRLIYVKGIKNKLVCGTLFFSPRPWLFDILMRKLIM